MQAFVVIAVYNMTRMKVALIPLVVRVWIESKVAIARAKARAPSYFFLFSLKFNGKKLDFLAGLNIVYVFVIQ